MHAAGVSPGSVLVVNFDCRRVVVGGQFLVDFDGWPELLQFRQFPCGLRARIGGRWAAVSGDDLRDMAVIGRVLHVEGTTASSRR